ncbi:MBL fold metallo-hydrolase [Planococcus salinus]|uniref:MBL fold metallo-hydrolase n=1 Tax=Planococcus salinus TaxID=1848460 RepID=A0A3M8P6D2_9BACL|nr:MBL fold metallo-hydrolase [Planococcus salinus]RNF39256.1 MBL fold metallo-hydrolase [Planococcus salinus]
MGKAEPAADLEVHFIDVGQADATLVKSDDFTVLIDTGNWNSSAAVDYLHGQDITEIDILIGTHPDADHIGQMDRIMEQFEVGEVWMSGNTSTSDVFIRTLEAIDSSGADYYEPRAGEIFDIGDIQIDVLYPEEITGKANEESISLKLTYGEVDFVFTGDAGVKEEQEMVNAGFDLDAEILQLGHHGSNTSTSSEFLQAVSPEVAIYSAGAENSYGHPHAEVIAAAENAGAVVYGTDVNGTVIVETDGERYSVSAEREGVPVEGVNRCIDLNVASSAELQEIEGIGPAYAEDIISGRPFETIDDLEEIKGIGQGTIDRIKAQGLVCTGG